MSTVRLIAFTGTIAVITDRPELAHKSENQIDVRAEFSTAQDFISQHAFAPCCQQVTAKPPLLQLFPSCPRGWEFVHVVAVEDGNRAGIGRVGSLKGRARFPPFEKEPERRIIGGFEADALTSAWAPAIERNRLPF